MHKSWRVVLTNMVAYLLRLAGKISNYCATPREGRALGSSD
jgi:hypothetical protein